MVELETERLIMRQWRESDLNVYAEFYSNQQAARFVGGQVTRDKAWRQMASIVGHWVLRGYGLWAIEQKQAPGLIGCVGLWEPEGWPELEVGYWLVPKAHGHGYATEAAIRARDYAYTELEAETLVSYIDPANEPSKHVAERMGAWHEATIELLDHGPHCVYRHPSPSMLNGDGK